jgi:hypothetical protein
VYGAVYLAQQSTVTITLTNANTWYADTNTTWLTDYSKDVSGTTTGRLYVLPNRDGVYQVIGLGCFGVAGTADDFDVGIMVNGSSVPNDLWKSYDITSGSQYDPVFITGEIKLNAGNYINFALRNPVAAGSSTRVRSAYLFLNRIRNGSI